MNARRMLAVAVAILVGSVVALGQSQPNVENGFKAYGSYDGSHLDSVNLLDSNVLLHVPLDHHAAQRGKLAPELLLYVTSQSWRIHCDTSPTDGSPGNCYWSYGGAGIELAFTGTLSVHRRVVASGGQGFPTTYEADSYSLSTWDGGTHPLQDISAGAGTSFESIDGTGYRVALTNPDTNGLFANAAVTDRQGNQYQTSFVVGRCTRPTIQPVYNPGGHPIM